MKGTTSIAAMFLFLQLCFVSKAMGDESYKLCFSKDDFSFRKDSLGRIYIISEKQSAFYGEDISSPALPLFSVNFALPSGDSYCDTEITLSKKLIMKDINMTPAPQSYTTNFYKSAPENKIVDYTGLTFPDKNVEYICTSTLGDINIARFIVCPFVYDSKTKELYIVTNIDMKLKTTGVRSLKRSININNETIDMVKSTVYNEHLIDSLFSKVENYARIEDRIDYIIITNKTLAASYKPLADWKTTKGIRTKVITTEYINSFYKGNDLQEKIKRCIYSMYKTHGVKYVMLGGDDTVVPVRGCYGKSFDYGKNEYLIDETIPTDLYYACFNGDFGWNANGNNLYGEVEDSIDFTPAVFVTRLPVRTDTDVNSYIYKFLTYEKDPLSKEWSNTFISMGSELKNELPVGKSSSEKMADYFYENYIKGHWDGAWYKFFDTGTNIPDKSNYEFHCGNIHEEFSKGYSFVDFISHGLQYGWLINPSGGYSCYEVNRLENKGFSIITTNACMTNAFDSTEKDLDVDPCLSESFIRNRNSGVLAYLGCSRSGWYSAVPYPLYSTMYNDLFYQNLFSTNYENKNYGVLVAAAKNSMVNSCNKYNCDRWIQLGLNPIGDPEMPIYTEIPKEFTKAKVNVVGVNKLEVDTGIDNATICVMSTDDNGRAYYKVAINKSSDIFTDIPSQVSVCITKQNYIPKIFSMKSTYIQNESISDSTEYLKNDVIYIGSSVTKLKASGAVTFSSPSAVIEAGTVIIEPEMNISKESNIEIRNIK